MRKNNSFLDYTPNILCKKKNDRMTEQSSQYLPTRMFVVKSSGYVRNIFTAAFI